MANQGGNIDGGRELAEVTNQNGRLGSLLERIITGINKTAENAAVSPTGTFSAPKPPDSVSVKVAGEMMHVSVSHSGLLNKGINYFTEVSTTPQFGQATTYGHHHGTSRTPPPIFLPTFLDDGITKQNYYVRTLAQYPGSHPSAPTVVGGIGTPTAFQMSGTTAMTLLPSTGTGTSPNNGSSMGQGFGKFPQRQV